MRVLDLFSGIGGFSIGLEKAGFETVAFCEIEKYCQEVLKRHWPDTPIYDDVRTLSAQQLRADGIVRPDIIVGGYPCQPFSLAGVRRGEEDDRHLWPEVYRLIKEIRPTWGIFENVAGHITMGLDEVLSDLEAEGYAARPFVIPACGVDAPHRRDRVWIVANTRHQPRRDSISGSVRGNGAGQYAERKRSNEAAETARPSETSKTLAYADHTGSGTSRRSEDGERAATEQGWQEQSLSKSSGQREAVADTNDSGLQGVAQTRHDGEDGTQPDDEQFEGRGSAHEPSEGRPTLWKPEPNVGRVANGIPARSHRIKALGNAVVPQIPEQIGRIIMQIEGNND